MTCAYDIDQKHLQNVNDILEDNKISFENFIALLNEIENNTWKLSEKYNLHKQEIVYLRKIFSHYSTHQLLIKYIENLILNRKIIYRKAI